jgi:putative nucleotidyltransferase with HDIG domain
VAARLLSMLGDEERSLHDVAKIVQYDSALTARVLRIANSAAFSRGRPITSLFRAIMHLGMRMVVGITIGTCASRLMNRQLDGYDSDAGELWDHSLRTAISAREFAFFCYKPIPEDLAFTAGLLHDIGKSVLSEFLVGSAEKMARMCQESKVTDYLAAERELLGTDHAAVGYAIAQRWGLPKSLAIAIKDHHNPAATEPEQQELVYTVHLGDLIAMLGGVGTGSDTLAYRIDENYQKFINIKEAELSRLLLNVQTEFALAREVVFAMDEATI